MPIANTPMIDYTIKFLRDNRIKDIIVYTSNNRDKIKAYFKKVPLLEGVNVKVFSTEERSRYFTLKFAEIFNSYEIVLVKH